MLKLQNLQLDDKYKRQMQLMMMKNMGQIRRKPLTKSNKKLREREPP